MPYEGQRGTAPDGTPVVFRGGKAIPIDAGGLEVLGGGYKRNQIGQVYETGPKGGTKMISGPSFTAANDAQKNASGINQSLAGIDRVDRQLKKTKDIGPLGWITNPTDIAVLQQSVRDLHLKLKEQPYNLGVLNGPDLDLLESIVANPAQLKSATFRQTIAPRLANLSSILGNTYRQQSQGFAGLGGQEEALPPLYRSPSSKFTPQEWGRKGEVPRNAFDRSAPKSAAPAQKAAPTYKYLGPE
jgi:hypothetical protein